MDYKKIMGDDTRSFPEYYEEVIVKLEGDLSLDNDLKELLRSKRLFGLQKYGEHSFQSNFENAVKVPVIEHLTEEMIDAFNYTLHAMYQRKLLGKKDNKKLLKVIKHLKKSWELVVSLSQ